MRAHEIVDLDPNVVEDKSLPPRPLNPRAMLASEGAVIGNWLLRKWNRSVTSPQSVVPGSVRFESRKYEMQQANGTGMMLFRENAELPDFTKDSEFFMPGWRIIKNLDGYALQQKMKGSNWSIRHVVGEKKARVMGRTTQETLLRGIGLILTELRGRRFNALEVTVVTVRRFFGVTYLNISANLKHFESA